MAPKIFLAGTAGGAFSFAAGGAAAASGAGLAVVVLAGGVAAGGGSLFLSAGGAATAAAALAAAPVHGNGAPSLAQAAAIGIMHAATKSPVEKNRRTIQPRLCSKGSLDREWAKMRPLG